MNGHGCPTSAAVRGPMTARNSSESTVKRPSGSICQMKRSGWRRSSSAAGAAAGVGAGGRSGNNSGCTVSAMSIASGSTGNGAGGAGSGGGGSMRGVGGGRSGAGAGVGSATGVAECSPIVTKYTGDSCMRSIVITTRSSSDWLSPIARRAAAVAPISTPSSPNTATGSTLAASSRVTRSCSGRCGPEASAAAISTAAVPSARVMREQAQVSTRPIAAPNPRSRSSRTAPSSRSVAATRATSAAAVCVRSKVRTARAAGVGALKTAAPVGLAHISRVASGDHSHAGVGRSANGLRRRSCNQPIIAHRCAGKGPACSILNGFLLVGG